MTLSLFNISTNKRKSLHKDPSIPVWVVLMIVLTALADITQSFVWLVILFTAPAFYIAISRGLIEGAFFNLFGYGLVIVYAVLTYDHIVDGVYTSTGAEIEFWYGLKYLFILSAPAWLIGSFLHYQTLKSRDQESLSKTKEPETKEPPEQKS
jgi:hypothetical protein